MSDEVVELYKVKGELNPADLLTKPLGRVVLDGHLDRLRLRREEGRAASAPAASAEVDTSLAAPAPRFLRDTLDGSPHPSLFRIATPLRYLLPLSPTDVRPTSPSVAQAFMCAQKSSRMVAEPRFGSSA